MKRRLQFNKMRWHRVSFGVCLVVSIGLIVGGFLVPPTGVIDGSVLTGVGELFGFAALAQIHSLVARGKGVKIQHGATSVSVGDEDDFDSCEG